VCQDAQRVSCQSLWLFFRARAKSDISRHYTPIQATYTQFRNEVWQITYSTNPHHSSHCPVNTAVGWCLCRQKNATPVDERSEQNRSVKVFFLLNRTRCTHLHIGMNCGSAVTLLQIDAGRSPCLHAGDKTRLSYCPSVQQQQQQQWSVRGV